MLVRNSISIRYFLDMEEIFAVDHLAQVTPIEVKNVRTKI